MAYSAGKKTECQIISHQSHQGDDRGNKNRFPVPQDIPDEHRMFNAYVTEQDSHDRRGKGRNGRQGGIPGYQGKGREGKSYDVSRSRTSRPKLEMRRKPSAAMAHGNTTHDS